MKKYAIGLLKFTIPLVIIGWLLASVDRSQLAQLWEQGHNWPLLVLSFGLTFTAILLSFFRWYLLVRVLELPFRIADALRLGFLGYLLMFVSGGAVGGDVFKAAFIAHEQPGRRAEAVATVLIDRIAGMLSLFLMTSLAVLIASPVQADPVVRAICNLTLLATAVGFGGLLLILVPPHTSELLRSIAKRIPRLGGILLRLVNALQVYRRKPLALLSVLACSLSVHALLTFSLYLAAVAVLKDAPSLGDHFIIVPLSMVAGALPLTPAGLGTFELAMDQLYLKLPATPCSDGILVALAYRLMTILVSAIGVVYYWTSRREVKELMKEAEEQEMPGKHTPEAGC